MDKIHLKSPKGWINDPNGFIYFKGKYHLFYQHFPYAPCWGRMHWGHAVSDDLINWEHLDTALFPSKTNDMDGCFSGSAIEHNGKMHLFYTGVRYEEYDPENTNCCLNDKFVSSQILITSDDGYKFDNFSDKSTIIRSIEDAGIGDRTHTRDPKVWKDSDGCFYMVLGTTAEQKGKLLFYKSRDLKNWKYMNSAAIDNIGWMWECPDYFEANGKGVLIFSPMGLENGNQTFCTLAEFDENNCSMDIDPKTQYFDYGLDLYAPQSTTDKDGKRIVIAWLRMPEKMSDNTIGMFCMPRVCEVSDGHIWFKPHPDIRAKFRKPIYSPKKASEGKYMLYTSIEEGSHINIGGYIIGRKDGKVYTDRTNVSNKHINLQNHFETPNIAHGYDIEVYVDNNIIEVFVNGGEYVITNAVYGMTDEIKEGSLSEIRLYGLEE